MVEIGRFLSRYRSSAAAALIVFVGYLLRAYRVAYQGLRGDEAFSVGFFSRPFGEVWASMGSFDPNPPLYYFVLHNWMRIAGTSEAAVRWPSVLAGVIVVALTYRLGRMLLGRPAGFLAASFAVVNPFLIWHAQDARVYSLLTALVLAAVWQTWQAATRVSANALSPQDALRPWLVASGLWWLALFAHYFAILPLVVIGIALLLAPATRLRWFAALMMAVGVGLAYLPIVLHVFPLLAGHTKGWIQPPTLSEAVWRLLTAFSVGASSNAGMAGLRWVGGGLLALLLVAGAIGAIRRAPSAAIWLLALGLGPATLAWLVSLARPVFAEQYLISSLPGLLIIAAASAFAIKALPRWTAWLSALPAAGLGLVALLSLKNYYFDPAYAKSPNWRGVVAYLEATARLDEVVVLNLPDPGFYHYYHGPMPVEASPPDSLSTIGVPAAEAQLRQLRDRYQHIRFFFSPSPLYDPEGFVGQWLETCCEKTSDTFVYGFRVQAFDTPSGSLAARQPYPVEFEKGITLTGYRVLNPQLRAGEAIHLTLYWTARERVAESYTVFVHLLAADGFNVAGADNLPRDGSYPTDQWLVSEMVIDPHLVPLPADMPPGDYRLDVGLYRLDTGQRLMGRDASGVEADHVLLPVILTVQNP